MFNANQNKQSNLVRFHPKSGGKNIAYGNQFFHGVSTDVFISFDQNDLSQSYKNIRKLNIAISIDPSKWSTEKFLSYLTNNQIQSTKKCTLHGDKDTGLEASHELKRLLKLDELSNGFTVDGLNYVYDSIGVACNPGYQSASKRQGNDFEARSSHFEIKFVRQTEPLQPIEYLCLNIHLMPDNTGSYKKNEALGRLQQAINLFYAELGLKIAPALYQPLTSLRTALRVTVENHKELGFSGDKHEKSEEALNNHDLAVRYTKDPSICESYSLFDFASTTPNKKQKRHKKKIARVLDDDAINASVLNNHDKQPEEAEEVVNAWPKK